MTVSVSGTTLTYTDSTTQVSAAKVINFQRFTNNTRYSFPEANANTIWGVSCLKVQASSKLLVKVNISLRTNASDCLVWEMKYGPNGTIFQGTQPYDAGFGANAKPYHSVFFITDSTLTGYNSLGLSWRTNNTGDGNRPSSVWNPNGIDDARLNQQYSSIQVWEIV